MHTNALQKEKGRCVQTFHTELLTPIFDSIPAPFYKLPRKNSRNPLSYRSEDKMSISQILESYLRAYSVLWSSALLLGIAAYVIFRKQRNMQEWIAFGTLLAILFVAWMALHPRATPLDGDAVAVLNKIGKGMPVLLELQSPFCLGCTALRPLVDKIEQTYRGKLIVIRVNIQSTSGRELARYFDMHYTPTFIFFDAQGQERWRSVGELDPNKVAESLSIP